MKLFAVIQQVIAGWIMILRGEAGWQDRFRLTAPGLATALALFYVFAFLAVVFASMQVGVPTVQGFVDIMLIQSLWLVALLIGIFGTRAALKSQVPVLPILIPGIYALIAYLVLGSLLSMVIGVLLPILWIGLLIPFFRLGRVAGGWSLGVSAAFAVLTVVLLVGLPMTLYMLIASPIPAA